MGILLRGPIFHNVNGILFILFDRSYLAMWLPGAFFLSTFVCPKNDFPCPKLYEYIYSPVQNSSTSFFTTENISLVLSLDSY